MTPRELVGSRIASVLVEILERAAKDSGMWPLNDRQRAGIEDMRARITRTAVGIPEEGIARLLELPVEGMAAFIRTEIEPAFRREIAGRFVS